MTTPDTLTAEKIALNYSAAMDSVNLINELLALPSLDNEQQDTINRNVKHLEIMVAKDYWTTEDITPFNTALADALDV